MVLRERFQASNNSHVIKVIDPFIADSKVHMLTGGKKPLAAGSECIHRIYFFYAE